MDADPLLAPEGEWVAAHVMRCLGPAVSPDEHLPRLLTATACVLGPQRLKEFYQDIAEMGRVRRASLESLKKDEILYQNEQRMVGRVLREFNQVFSIRNSFEARLRNQFEEVAVRSALRASDLLLLVRLTRAALHAEEWGRERSRRGLLRKRTLLMNPPSLLYAKEWSEKLLGTNLKRGPVLFFPRELGRVVLVKRDGSLLYDPGIVGVG